MWQHSLRTAVLVSAIGLSLASAAAVAAQAEMRGDRLVLSPKVSAPAYQLRVIGPGGSVFEDTFLAGETIGLTSKQLKGGWVDGSYRYEITPVRGVNIRPESQAGKGGTSRPAGAESGAFRVKTGRVYVASNTPEQTTRKARTTAADAVAADQVIPDDLIVQGSTCVGFDCVANESFGFDTIKLKENNTRIKFEDTSSTAGYASNDWQLIANDSASGGLNKFSIEDVSGAKVPFTLIAGAPSNSLYVDSTGKVGLRTSTPVLDVHANTGDTPAIRLEQNNSGGYTAQTWDIAGNEANFFVRDLTSGSRLPFRIRPGAPTSSLDIAASGNVGMGTSSPSAALDVARAGDTTIRLSNTQTTGFTNEWDIKNNSASGRLTFSDDATGARSPVKFAPSAINNLFRVGVLATDTVDINGNLVVTGTITPDYVFKKDFPIPSIQDHAKMMWASSHLPKLTPAKVNERGQGVINVGERSQAMLEELEYAHIYIEQLHGNMQNLQQDMAQKTAELTQLREEIAAIKAALSKQ